MVRLNLANCNQFEREMISERTRDALQHMKSQGVRLGPASYGYELSHECDEHGRRIIVPLPGPRIPLLYDREASTARACELRVQGLSLNQIGQRLRKERLTPPCGGIWHPAQVAKLLQEATRGDKEAASRRAHELRAQGLPPRAIGIHLATEGILPRGGGIWYPASVQALLAGDESASVGG